MKLYHYTSGAGLYGIIESMELHCSHIDFLNDPTEVSYFDSIIQNSEFQKIHDEMFDKNYSEFMYNDSKYILSFCQNDDLLTMWNYYAQGNGYCIGLNVDVEKLKYISLENDYFIDSFDMIYDVIKQKLLITEFVNSIKFELSQIEPNCITEIEKLRIKYVDDIVMLKSKFKHPAYNTEMETRLKIVIPDYNRNYKTLTSHRMTSNGTFVEYFKLPIDGDSIRIESIKCHPLATNIQIKGLQSYINHKLGFNNVIITKSNIPFREL